MAIHKERLLVIEPGGPINWANRDAKLELTRNMLDGSLLDVLSEEWRKDAVRTRINALAFPIGSRAVMLDCSVIRPAGTEVVYDVQMGDGPVMPDKTYFCDLFPEATRPAHNFMNETGLLVVDLKPEANDLGLIIATGIYADGEDRVTLSDPTALLSLIDRVLQPQ